MRAELSSVEETNSKLVRSYGCAKYTVVSASPVFSIVYVTSNSPSSFNSDTALEISIFGYLIVGVKSTLPAAGNKRAPVKVENTI